MASAIGNASGVNLNTSSAEELDRVGGLGYDRVQRIIQIQRFHWWDDLRRVEGLGSTLVEDLKSAGATLG